MQQEDLIKRLRVFAVIISLVFVALIVTLIVQFGYITHYHQEIKTLRNENAALQERIEANEYQIAYEEGTPEQ